MRSNLIQGFRLFSRNYINQAKELSMPNPKSGPFQYINELRKSGQFAKALDVLADLEKSNPGLAFKTSPFLRGQITEEQLRATGKLDSIFTSPLLKR